MKPNMQSAIILQITILLLGIRFATVSAATREDCKKAVLAVFKQSESSCSHFFYAFKNLNEEYLDKHFPGNTFAREYFIQLLADLDINTKITSPKEFCIRYHDDEKKKVCVEAMVWLLKRKDVTNMIDESNYITRMTGHDALGHLYLTYIEDNLVKKHIYPRPDNMIDMSNVLDQQVNYINAVDERNDQRIAVMQQYFTLLYEQAQIADPNTFTTVEKFCENEIKKQ